MNTVLLNIDIKGFVQLSAGKTTTETANLLDSFYQTAAAAMPASFRIVKATGDSLLVAIEVGLAEGIEAEIRELKSTLDKSNQVRISYRPCSVAVKEIQIGDYNCLDVFGTDVNGLFLNDEKTTVLD